MHVSFVANCAMADENVKALPRRGDVSRSRSPLVFTEYDDSPPSPSVLRMGRVQNRRCTFVGRYDALIKETAPKKDVTETCTECSIYHAHSHSGKDRSNEFFGKLLNEQLKYLHICIRSRCYIQILKYFEEAKGNHTHELSFDFNSENLTSSKQSSNKDIAKVCTDCEAYEPLNDKDKMNEAFGQLVAEQFNYVHPCIRSKCYIQILSYILQAKGNHAYDDFFDSENQK